MRIGIDARFYNESGVGRYLRNLISNLEKLDKENEYFIFLLSNDFEKFEEKNNFKKIKTDFKWYGFAEQFKFPGLLKKLNLDLVHFPHFNVPVFYQGKFVVTIHDLIHQHYKTKRATILNPVVYNFKQFGYKKVFKNAIKNSKKIIVPSNNVSELLVKEWGIDLDKIKVTKEGVDENILAILKKISTRDIEKTLNKFDIKKEFIFYVGNAHPHKNVEGLIKAYLELQKNNENLHLVLSGSDHFFWKRIKEEYKNSAIIFTNQITDEELVILYKASKLFVLPSFEEGFGIPLLEAMACGTPIVSSNGGSLPEIAKDSAIYFDPRDTNDMVEKITKVLDSEKLRKELIEKGYKRVKLFSWEEMAKQTLTVYKGVLEK